MAASSKLPKSFYPFIFGVFLSHTGTFMQIIAEGWLVAELSPEPFWTGVVGFCGGVPMLLFLSVGGAIADRFDRRKLLLIAQFALFVVAGSLSLLTYFEVIQIWHVAVLAFLTGLGGALNYPSYQGFLFDIVGKEGVAKAVTWNAVTVHLSRLIGPVLAGVLISVVGAAGCFTLNAFSFLVVIPLIAFVPVRAAQVFDTGNWGDLWKGLVSAAKYVKGEPLLRDSLLVTALSTVLILPHIHLLPLYVKVNVQMGPEILGTMWGVSAAGSLVGNVTYASVSHRLENHLSKVLTACIFGSGLSLVALSLSQHLAFIYACLFLLGLFVATSVVAGQTIIQFNVRPSYRGRVMGMWGTCFQGMFPVGSFLIGTLAQFVTIPTAWLIAAVSLLAILAFVQVFGRQSA